MHHVTATVRPITTTITTSTITTTQQPEAEPTPDTKNDRAMHKTSTAVTFEHSKHVQGLIHAAQVLRGSNIMGHA
jgi:hypothetical protein